MGSFKRDDLWRWEESIKFLEQQHGTQKGLKTVDMESYRSEDAQPPPSPDFQQWYKQHFEDELRRSSQATMKVGGKRKMAPKAQSLLDKPPVVGVRFEDYLIGQPEAMRILDYVEIYKAGLNQPDKPAGTFLLAGSTGVGKTQSVMALALSLHGDAKRCKIINCGEFQMDHEVAKLVGAPPGYLGHKETNAILTTKSLNELQTSACQLGLLLFDEIEKGAPALQRILLGILDKGKLQLGTNETVDFSKTMIFMTTNLGAVDKNKKAIGMVEQAQEENRDTIKMAIKRFFSPEFYNRIDDTIFYRRLDIADAFQILDLMIEEQATMFRSKNLFLRVSQGAKDALVKEGFSEAYGARELARSLRRMVVVPAAKKIVGQELAYGTCVSVESDGQGGVRVALRND